MEWLISKWGKHCAHSFNKEYVTGKCDIYRTECF